MGTTLTGGTTGGTTGTRVPTVTSRDAFLADNGLMVRPYSAHPGTGYNVNNMQGGTYANTTNRNYAVMQGGNVIPTTTSNFPPSYQGSTMKTITPNKRYAQKISTAPALNKPVAYTYQNLETILGKKYQLPNTTHEIYNIKELGAAYQGQFSGKGYPFGKGTAYFRDGGYYTGDFIDGEAHGNGLYIYPNGSVYEGSFQRSQFNGHGTLYYIDKRLRYTGMFVNGTPMGQGQQSFGDGSYYRGTFKNGVKDGQGIYQWANGQRYEGGFANGLMEGKGILSKNGMVLYSGNWSKGMKNGYGVYRTETGSYEGNFDNDMLNGPGTFIWNDGKVYEGNFFNSMFNGKGRMYYPSNQVADGEWVSNHNKSLTALKNDASVAQKIRQIRSKHDLASKPVPAVVKTSSYGSDQYNQSSVIRKDREYDESMRQDDSYYKSQNTNRRAGDYVYDDRAYGQSGVYSSNQPSGVQDSYARNSNVVYN